MILIIFKYYNDGLNQETPGVITMEYDIHIDYENRIVLCAARGVLDLESARSMTRDARKKSFELDYGLLYDVTEATLNVKIVDAYSFPRDIKNIYEDNAHRRGKAAIVYKSDKDFWEFFETTARNAGVIVKLFREKKEAIEWLSEV